MTRLNRPEQQYQRAVIQHIAWRARPGVFAFHVPNGGWRSRVDGAILKAIGTVAGVPDLIWIKNCQVYGLELKAEGGRPTEAQLATMAAIEAAGAYCCIAEGLDPALAVLEGGQLLRGAP